MKLTADVLDQWVFDHCHRRSGKIDGIALEIIPGSPPRIAYLEIGSDVLARRLSKRLERFLSRHGAKPTQIPWSKVESVDIAVTLDMDVTETPAYDVEMWLREHLIEKIPGNAHQKHQEESD